MKYEKAVDYIKDYITKFLVGDRFKREWITPDTRLGPYENGIGMDSLDLAEFAMKAGDDLGIEIGDDEEFLDNMTVGEAARYLVEKVKSKAPESV